MKNKYGQYFTPEDLANFMLDLADFDDSTLILEPSCGEGVFLKCLENRGHTNYLGYEIDNNLSNNPTKVINESFVSSKINQKFDLIIGNPPYIRWKNLEENLKYELANCSLWSKNFNSLCDYSFIFIAKSVELLNDKGQLIFICPDYWLSSTNAQPLRDFIVKNGTIETLYIFTETPLFKNVNSSFVIFKFIKNDHLIDKTQIIKYKGRKSLSKKDFDFLLKKERDYLTEVIETSKFELNRRWQLQEENSLVKLNIFESKCTNKNLASKDLFDENEKKLMTIGEICDIGNGMVSGLDRAFQLTGDYPFTPLEKTALISVLKGKNLAPYVFNDITKYFLILNVDNECDFKSGYPHIYNHLINFRAQLESRYEYKKKSNYWEWSFLRNINLFKSNAPKIFVPCKERISNKNFFRFSIAPEQVFPTQDVTALYKKNTVRESLQYITAFLNQDFVFDWLKANGTVKGNIVEFSEQPLSKIPFRAINWGIEHEKNIHEKITSLVDAMTCTKSINNTKEIKSLFEELFS